MDLWIDVKLVEREPLRIYGARGKAALESFADRYAPLFRKAFMLHLQVVGAPLAIYHSDHFDGQLIDMEIALPVNGDAEGVRELSGGLHAVTTHNGPYSTLPVTHTLLGMWIIQNGYRVCGAPFNLYVRGGNDKILSPDQYSTEVFYPIEKDIPPPDIDLSDFGLPADE